MNKKIDTNLAILLIVAATLIAASAIRLNSATREIEQASYLGAPSDKTMNQSLENTAVSGQ